MDFEAAVREHEGAMRPPLVCGRTTSGERWRVFAFDIDTSRSYVFAERSLQGPDGTWTRAAVFGVPRFNAQRERHVANKLSCKVNYDELQIETFLDDSETIASGWLNVSVLRDGNIEESLTILACGTNKPKGRSGRKKRTCGD